MGEIIVQDMGGINNADLTGSRARLVKGGSWKKQNICVIMPAAASIPAKVALAIWNLAFPPNNGVVRLLALGMEVGDAYSSCIEQVLADPNLSQYNYILTIEHDNAPPPDGVLKLVDTLENYPELAAVSGGYFTKGIGTGVYQAWGDPRDPTLNFRPLPPPANGGLLECCGLGMGFCLFRLDMFKDTRIPRPWFKTQKENGMMTQDLYFWQNARKYGYRCGVNSDVRVGHYDLEGKFGLPDTMY